MWFVCVAIFFVTLPRYTRLTRHCLCRPRATVNAYLPYRNLPPLSNSNHVTLSAEYTRQRSIGCDSPLSASG
jgi:hypothetical protein